MRVRERLRKTKIKSVRDEEKESKRGDRMGDR